MCSQACFTKRPKRWAHLDPGQVRCLHASQALESWFFSMAISSTKIGCTYHMSIYVYICLYIICIYNIYILYIYTYIYIYGLCSRAMSGKLAKHNKHKALDGKVPPYLRVLKFPLKCSRIKNSYKNKQSLSPTKVLSQNPWFGIGGWDYRNMMWQRRTLF